MPPPTGESARGPLPAPVRVVCSSDVRCSRGPRHVGEAEQSSDWVSPKVASGL